MTEARKFLIDDITALLNPNKTHEWLNGVNDDGLYALWQDLIKLTTLEEV